MLLAVLVGLAAAHASSARAGTWIQVSCVNPNGSASNSAGWSAAENGPGATGAFANTACAPGTPLVAAQNVVFGTPPSSTDNEALNYTPPAGSSLAGGNLDVALEAYGYGTSSAPAFTLAAVAYPGPGSAVAYVGCAQQGCTGNTSGPATVTLPAGESGSLTVAAGCANLLAANDPCSQTNNPSVYDRASVYSADLLLTTQAEPAASGFHGTALQRNASGTAGLVFSASDPVGSGADAPSGPGVYAVSVAIDGRTRWTGTPNTNGGTCVPAGSSGSVLEFDGQQPCPPAETVDVPVPTRGLPDGRHRLTVSVTDAAGGSATVLDQYISTFNPQITPLPKGHMVRARFLLSWHWKGRTTRLRSVAVRHLPKDASISVSCRGRGCPHVATSASGARADKRLVRGLGAHPFHAGDRLYLTVTAPRRRPERIVLRIRKDKIPSAKLL